MNENTKVTGKLRVDLYNTITGVHDIRETPNLFLTAGRNSMALALAGVTVDKRGIITYVGVGTGLTAPAITDTILEAETFRKKISVASAEAGVALFEVFFSTSEANGTIDEFGLFGDDATATADTGVMYAHTLMNRVKTNADTLTLQWSITIN